MRVARRLRTRVLGLLLMVVPPAGGRSACAFDRRVLGGEQEASLGVRTADADGETAADDATGCTTKASASAFTAAQHCTVRRPAAAVEGRTLTCVKILAAALMPASLHVLSAL